MVDELVGVAAFLAYVGVVGVVVVLVVALARSGGHGADRAAGRTPRPGDRRSPRVRS